MTDTPTPEQAGNEATDPNAQQAAVPPAVAPQQAAPGFAPAAPAAPAAPQDPNAAAGYPQPMAPATPPTNPLAIVALIGSFFIGLVGIICGHIALSQIKKSNGQQGGRGLALAGTIIGYVQTAGMVIAIIVMIAAMAVAGSIASQSISSLEKAQQQLEEQVGGDGLTAPETAGDRSPEFCEAFNELNAMGEDLYNTDGSVKSETVAALQKLADISSPNQQVYQDYYGFLQDLTTASETLSSDYIQAVMEDLMACA